MKEEKLIKTYQKGKKSYYLYWIIISVISTVINFFIFKAMIELNPLNLILLSIGQFFIIKNIFLELAKNGWNEVERTYQLLQLNLKREDFILTDHGNYEYSYAGVSIVIQVNSFSDETINFANVIYKWTVLDKQKMIRYIITHPNGKRLKEQYSYFKLIEKLRLDSLVIENTTGKFIWKLELKQNHLIKVLFNDQKQLLDVQIDET